MDNASTIEERINALKELHDNGIYTILFMSPIFPYITDWKEIIDKTKNFVDEYWFENLNLRGNYKTTILQYIKKKYSKYYDEYFNIYLKGNKDYWNKLSKEIEKFCLDNEIKYTNFFYHDKLVSEKKKRCEDE